MFRVIAYVNVLSLVSWIPFIFVNLAVNIYSLYLIFIGLQVVHRLNPRQAGGTVPCFFAVTLFFVLGLFLLAGGNVNESMKMLGP